MQTRTLTIVFTDIKGFTERTSAADRAFVLRLIETHDRLLKPIIRQYQGTLVKTIGDAYLLTFESPTNAVLCAIVMQETLHDHNAKVAPEERIEIRVAINTGEVNLVPNDILGEAVNVASRVESITEPNEIWFTEATYLAMNKQEVPNSLVGEFRLKGIPEALKVYRVVLDRESELFKNLVVSLKSRQVEAQRSTGAAPAKSGRGRVVLALLLVALLAGLFAWRHVTGIGPFAEKAATFLAQKKFAAALEQAGKALERAPESAEALALLRHVAGSAIRDHLSRGEVREARALYDDTYRRHPALDPMPDEETEICLAEALEMVKRGAHREVPEFLERLAVRHARRPATIFAIGSFFNRTGVNWTCTVRYLHEASALAPAAYAADPATVEAMTYFLRHVLPSEGYPEIRDRLATVEFDRYKDLLASGLADDSSETRVLRRNALHIYRSRKIPADEAAVHRAELFVSPGDPKEPEFAESMAFYRDLAAAGKPLPVPSPVTNFPLYEKYLLPADAPVHDLVAGPLFDAMKPWLEAALVDEANASRRLHAREALSRKGDLPAEALWRHHAANLIDREGIFRFGTPERVRLTEALAHISANDPPAGTSPDLLARLADAAASFAKEAREVIEEDREKEKADRRSPEFWAGVAEGADKVVARIGGDD